MWYQVRKQTYFDIIEKPLSMIRRNENFSFSTWGINELLKCWMLCVWIATCKTIGYVEHLAFDKFFAVRKVSNLLNNWYGIDLRYTGISSK